MDPVRQLLSDIETSLPDKYKILEGDDDTIYVKNTDTDKHFAIHIAECDE